MYPFRLISILLVSACCGLSCCTTGDGRQHRSSRDSIWENKAGTETVSTNIEELEKLIDFGPYRPAKVKFRYLFRNNTAQRNRIDIPGPSDYFVEALLFFDPETFRQLCAVSHLLPDTNRSAFRFTWLDPETKNELEHGARGHRGYPAIFFKTAQGKAYYLDRKVLISIWTE